MEPQDFIERRNLVTTTRGLPFRTRLTAWLRRSWIKSLNFNLAVEHYPERRIELVRAIARGPYTDATLTTFEEVMADPEPAVREQVARSLQRVGRLYDVIPLLVTLSADVHARVAWLARCALTNRVSTAHPHAVQLANELAVAAYIKSTTRWDKAVAIHLRSQGQSICNTDTGRSNLYKIADVIDYVSERQHSHYHTQIVIH